MSLCNVAAANPTLGAMCRKPPIVLSISRTFSVMNNANNPIISDMQAFRSEIFGLMDFRGMSYLMKRAPISNDPEARERLARTGDTSDEAISRRLKAAEKVSGMAQKEIAAHLGLSPTTLNSQVRSGRPSVKLMRYFYRSFRIDFNFILHGDLPQLPSNVQMELLAALGEREPS